MRRLLLLRHAKAVPAAEPLVDIARPLAERGERDAQRTGDRLRDHRLHPALILTSPAARALQTAQIVASAMGYAPENIAIERGLYLAEPPTLIEIIGAQKAAIETLLVVGHNPGLSELVQRLLPAFEVDDLPTAAVVGIDYADAEAWEHIANGTAALSYYDYPKNTRTRVTTR
jgi:phosphohistidine phosphatase